MLIVDDDERIRYLARAAAERVGEFADVLGAADGQAALESLQTWRQEHSHETPLIVLTDLSMPRVDGLQLTRDLKARADTRHIPVAMMTSSNQPNDRQDSLAAGCCLFFEKPVRFDDFVTLMGTLSQHCAAIHHRGYTRT